MRLDDVDELALTTALGADRRGLVIDFWGTWCAPCRSLRPHLEALADEYTDHWQMVAVHVETQPDLAERYGVRATPTLVFVVGGEEIHRISGAVPPSAVAEALVSHAPAA